MTIWGVRTDHPELDHVDNGFVGIGWDEVGDLTKIGPDKDLMKQRVAEARPTAKPGAIPVWAGVLLRFAFEIEVGDLVIYPNKLRKHPQLRAHHRRLLLRCRGPVIAIGARSSGSGRACLRAELSKGALLTFPWVT